MNQNDEDRSRARITREDGRNIVTLFLVGVIVMLVLFIERQSSALRDVASVVDVEEVAPQNSVVLRNFDPNTASLEELRTLGMTRLQSLSVIRYREFVRSFRIKEELINCYEMSDSLYYALEPYIVIGEEFRSKRVEYGSAKDAKSREESREESRVRVRVAERVVPNKFLVDTVSARYLCAIGALTQRQAEVFVRWRDMSGVHSEEELRKCYTISDSVATWLMGYVIFTPRRADESKDVEGDLESVKPLLVDLNRADSATLRSVRGIGAKSVVAILDYREKLGGFYSISQISELDCVTESNFRQIISQIFAESCDIS